jgi:hypothetical protein
VIVPLLLVTDGARRAESQPDEDRPLERDGAREPPLADRGEPENRRRQTKDLRREVIEDAEAVQVEREDGSVGMMEFSVGDLRAAA